MKVLCDTSTPISAMLPGHVHHAVTQPWLSKAKSGAFEFLVSAHSLVEVYSVLTQLPAKQRVPVHEAQRLIEENISQHATLVCLSDTDYQNLISDLAQNKIAGGAAYDAIIAKAAQVAGADHLLTLNTSDFTRVWPTHGGRIISPETTSPP